MNKRKPDALTELLRQGDPASGISETPDPERRAALLSRCAADPEPLSPTPLIRPDVSRWSGRSIAFGATALAACAALLGLIINPPYRERQPNTVSVAVATPSPSPSPKALPVPNKPERRIALSPRPTPTPAPVREVPNPHTTGNVDRANTKDTPARPVRKKRLPAPRPVVPSRSLDTPLQPLVVASKPTATPQPNRVSKPEPVVERVIIDLDDTPVQPTQPEPRVTSVAIVLTEENQSVIVSHAVPAPTKL
jgi:hypothetical protein